MRNLILIIIAIIAILFVFYFLGKKQCEQEHLVETIQTEAKTKEIIINQTKKVNERRNQALLVTPDANLVWLKENICQDC